MAFKVGLLSPQGSPGRRQTAVAKITPLAYFRMEPVKKPTVLALKRKKGEHLAMLTAYDFPTARLVADMPFLSYASAEQALKSAARLMKDAGADSVKVEGGVEVAPIVEALVTAGVPVLGHVGLTPQTASALGGYRLQGKDEAS